MLTRRHLLQLTSSASALSLSGCGVLLYPERQGRKSGNIDPLVAILDGVGLLFFVIPGLVAFAIDFYQGTIYLPGGRRTGLNAQSKNPMRTVKIDGPCNLKTIEAVLLQELNYPVNLAAPNVQAMRIHPDELAPYAASYSDGLLQQVS